MYYINLNSDLKKLAHCIITDIDKFKLSSDNLLIYIKFVPKGSHKNYNKNIDELINMIEIENVDESYFPDLSYYDGLSYINRAMALISFAIYHINKQYKKTVVHCPKCFSVDKDIITYLISPDGDKHLKRLKQSVNNSINLSIFAMSDPYINNQATYNTNATNEIVLLFQ